MADDVTWQLDESAGELLVTTGVAGRAAKMGHRLTIAMRSWCATVSWSGSQPTAVVLTVEVDALQVLRGEGGLTALSPPEKILVRSNALKCLEAERYPQIHFRAGTVEQIPGGYRLTGVLQIHGRTHPHTVDVLVTDATSAWRLRCASAVSQSEYGVRRYSMLMGAMQVADRVTVSLTADVGKPAQ